MIEPLTASLSALVVGPGPGPQAGPGVRPPTYGPRPMPDSPAVARCALDGAVLTHGRGSGRVGQEVGVATPRPRARSRDVPEKQCAGVFRSCWSGVQLIEQSLGLLQIERVEAFGEPAVDRREQSAGLRVLALIAPESCETDRGPQLE